MMLYGIGVDIVEVERIRSSCEQYGEAFLNRLFTEAEQEYCESQGGKRELSYAARFAAKEAVSKAFGTGIGGTMGWRELEVKRTKEGKPTVILHGKAREFAEELRVKEVLLSLSHSEHYAVANAIVILEAE